MRKRRPPELRIPAVIPVDGLRLIAGLVDHAEVDEAFGLLEVPTNIHGEL